MGSARDPHGHLRQWPIPPRRQRSFPELREHNITAIYHVLEAACRNHIPGVVLASSHHTIGFTPLGETVTHTTSNTPDSLYAVSKITSEALGYLYATTITGCR